MENREYLELPEGDKLRLVSSPPCSPVPLDWMLQVEEGPAHALPEAFDLDGDVGIVTLGDGRSIDLRSGSEVGVLRLGAIVCQRVAGQTRRQASISESEAGDYRQAPPPIIVIDSYQ